MTYYIIVELYCSGPQGSWIECWLHFRSCARGVSGVASLLPLMNSFNKTDAAFFSRADYVS